ncbi:uncharacterized protein L3040_000752 [Drepanopeziza brunnea f. sp. 'multigermtubi']|uniref:uncharacterized protein n=1 Tax=Drepanopeziza brunnea f. sp. 'multigermtubi' TaxID=698441 RepID=UPI00238B0400|nr:hypothetical protein L3040_000752 [Drepanopeziza brunnea f. sp. 'multigermtubi']
MPYTPPSQRSPAASAPHSPSSSRRSSASYQSGQLLSPASHRPELPRSTSYLNRHRRTTSLKTASFEPSLEPTPPGTADREDNETSSGIAKGSIRQSPPPVTGEAQVPAGAIISPPDSTHNSSDDEETRDSRGRDLDNLAELQAAIRIIEQHRESSPTRKAEEIGKANKALTLLMPPSAAEDQPAARHVDSATLGTLRKIAHHRSKTETVFLDLRSSAPETPLTGSEEESVTDEEEEEEEEEEEGESTSRRKPPMLRKKSGELVRPALRPSSARRRPSSMPGTPTFSKAVHFDSHLEHVRHFLQVDRPLAVSVGSSPVEQYDSETEFPFPEDVTQNPPFEWEISVSNFPAETPIRLALPIRVERVFLSSDNKMLVGSVAVANLSFQKYVVARFTLDYWKTTSEVVAEFNHDIRQPRNDGYDRFNFNIKLADQANLEAKTMFFCVKYSVNGQEYWDNNNATNFQVDFRKKARPSNGKKGPLGAANRSAGSLPRSNKRSPLANGRPRSMPVAFDDFADGFDARYQFDDFRQPVRDFMAESGPVRLKGVRSAVSLASDNLTRRAPQSSSQAFGNRYDFGASLSAAIQAANPGGRSGHSTKPASKKQQTKKHVPDAEEGSSPITMASKRTLNKSSPPSSPRTIAAATSAPGTDSPRPAGADKPALASQSYNELLDRYCFFGSTRNSPQLKDGTLRAGQLDGSSGEGFALGSAESSTVSSPMMMERILPPSQKASTRASRSASPAPMTGFASAIRG